jgi:hypothetical protein
VHPVGADHQVEGAACAAGEADLDAPRLLGHGRDAVAEEVLGGVPAVLVQHPGQVRAQHLEVTTREVGGQLHQLAALLVDEAHDGAAGLHPEQVLQHAHPFQHAQMGLAAEVDGPASPSQRGRDLHHGRAEAVAAQPVR